MSAASPLRAWFDGYVEAFNRADFEHVGACWCEDIEFMGQAAQLRGRTAVLDFYRGLRSRVDEEVRVLRFVGQADRIAAELETRLLAREDWPDFPTRPLLAGQAVGSVSFVFYELREGRFARIRSARYRVLTADEAAA